MRQLSLGIFLSHHMVLDRHFWDHHQDPINVDCASQSRDSDWASLEDECATALESSNVLSQSRIAFHNPSTKTASTSKGPSFYEAQKHTTGEPSTACSACAAANHSIRQVELFASLRIAQQLPRLENIRWASWFTASVESVRRPPWVTVWISRKDDGGIKAARKPQSQIRG